MKAKTQRRTLLILAVAAVLGAVLLGMSALKDQAAYFYAPADVTRKGVPLDQAVRIGGMVEEGSIRHAEDGVTIDFVVGDETEARSEEHTSELQSLMRTSYAVFCLKK